MKNSYVSIVQSCLERVINDSFSSYSYFIPNNIYELMPGQAISWTVLKFVSYDKLLNVCITEQHGLH